MVYFTLKQRFSHHDLRTRVNGGDETMGLRRVDIRPSLSIEKGVIHWFVVKSKQVVVFVGIRMAIVSEGRRSPFGFS
jgi:hypothetical protein